MVQAILAGRKTQTRRIAKLPDGTVACWHDGGEWIAENAEGKCWIKTIRPKCKVGDVIWVRESCAIVGHPELPYRYRADHLNPTSVRWTPSIHMPKTAARIWLRCTGVKAERVQDISTADIIAEGVQVPTTKYGSVLWTRGEQNSTLSLRYELEDTCGRTGEDFMMLVIFVHWAKLWIDINERESWDANPWVWAYSFEVLSTTGKPDNI